MMTAEACLKAAFQAILRGDYVERDRYCALAKNIMNVQDRLNRGYPPTEAVVPGVPICLPDQNNEKN